MSTIEIIISGHSDSTDDSFMLPDNFNVKFHAREGETCFVPYNKEGIMLAYAERFFLDKITHTASIPNYMILFTDQPFNGLFEVKNDELTQIPLDQNVISLHDLCSHLKELRPDNIINIYGIFCRGSRLEEIGDRVYFDDDDDIDPYTLDSLFSSDSSGPNSGPNSSDPYSSDPYSLDPNSGNFLDFLDALPESSKPTREFQGKSIANLRRHELEVNQTGGRKRKKSKRKIKRKNKTKKSRKYKKQ